MTIPDWTVPEMIEMLKRQAQKNRDAGKYERAKMNDDILELLENQKPNGEYTAVEREERTAAIREIWKRIREAAEGRI